jgi:hypothetical protein
MESMPTMDMPTYLAEIQHAASNLFPMVWAEADTVVRLETELSPLAEAVEREYRDIEHLAEMYGDDEDGLLTMRHWDNYFGPDKDRHYKNKELEEAILRLETHRFSISALAGSILQFAKQGLSVVYGNPAKWPQWAAIGTQPFGNIVVQARNQAMHWETPLTKSVAQCFDQMAGEADHVFADYQKRSLAFDVMTHLGWRTFEEVRTAMLRIV